jgi:membrane protein
MGERDQRGRQAEAPTDIPARGWKDVLARTAVEAKSDNLALLAAGVAFYGLLALVPGLVALVSIYGLVADPADVSRHVGDLLGAAPGEVRDLVREQLESISARSDTSAGVGAAVGLVVALWSASSGMKHLIDALNTAYDEEEGRGFLKVRGLSLLFTVGALVFLMLAFFGVALVPALVEGPLGLIRWPLLAAGFALTLMVLYRHGPSRDEAEWRWTSPGSLAATVLWLVGSGLFSLYVSNFSKYGETYGSLGSVVVVLLWLFLTSAAVLLGAELDAELERQTYHDTTEGPERPMGQRGAEAADTLGATADEVSARRRLRKERANR